MKLTARILIAMACAALCAAACSRGPEVIPRSKMEKICTELFLADEWLSTHNNLKAVADTTLFYEPIFNKYGYDTDDFRASLEYYMRDPLKFSRMMRKIALKMDSESRRMRGLAPVKHDEEAEESEEAEEAETE